MKTIGLLGGMSWESTAEYYRTVNEGIKKALGGLHSAEVVLYSVDFDPVEQLQHEGDWKGTADILGDAARKIEAGGADFLVICTNTMHKVAPEIERQITIPILHIADATAELLVEKGIRKVGLLGTAFTMEQDFYRNRLIQNYGLEVIVPPTDDRLLVHNIIYDELCRGALYDESRHEYLRIIHDLHSGGAEAVILGCTEIGLLVKQKDTEVLLFDTTAVHALKAVERALSED